MSSRAIKTQSGRMVDPFAIQPDDIFWPDIVFGLFHKYRYSGQSTITVGAHVVAGLEWAKIEGLPKPVLQSWLLHDAAEAYLVDFPSHHKKLYYVMTDDDHYVSVVEIEDIIHQVIRGVYIGAVPFEEELEHHDAVKRIDEEMYRYEQSPKHGLKEVRHRMLSASPADLQRAFAELFQDIDF